MTDAELDTILTALHERKNRLVEVNLRKDAHIKTVETLRDRIQAVNVAIRAVKKARDNVHGA